MHKAVPGISVNSDATRQHVSFDHQFNAVNVRLFVIKRRTMLLQRFVGLARCKSVKDIRIVASGRNASPLPSLLITSKPEYNSNTKKMENR